MNAPTDRITPAPMMTQWTLDERPGLTRFDTMPAGDSATMTAPARPDRAPRRRRADVKDQDAHDPEELVAVNAVAEEIGVHPSTVWLLIKRHDLDRYRLPGHGKTTFVRRGDVLRAYRTPIPLKAEKGKAAA